MCILASILPNTWRITLNIAGIERRLVERRGEEDRQSVLRTDQFALDCRHGSGDALARPGPGNHRPRLRDRIDPALFARRRAKRRTVIEPAPQIPISVPRLTRERLCESGGLCSPSVGAVCFVARIGERSEGCERCMQEPTEPNTLALPAFANAIHAVIPVAGTNQWQAMDAERETVF